MRIAGAGGDLDTLTPAEHLTVDRAQRFARNLAIVSIDRTAGVAWLAACEAVVHQALLGNCPGSVATRAII